MTESEQQAKIQQCRQLLALNANDQLNVPRKLRCAISQSMALQELRIERELLEVELMHLTGVDPVKAPEPLPKNDPPKDEGGDGKEPVSVG